MAARNWFERRGLVRARHGRWIGGVAAGMARRLDARPSVVRAAWIISVLIPGPQVLLYVALWVLMPLEPRVADRESA
jgi:phage shock protein C